MSIAAITLASEWSIVESGSGGICAAIGEKVKWKVHIDAVLIQRWKEGADIKTAVLYPRKLQLQTGAMVLIHKGEIEKQ
jgi:hypothetical protein